MKLVTPSQMRDIDAFAINELGIPGIVLMENAALKVFEQAADMLGGLNDLCGKNVLLLAGKGNNGGDAFAVARHLHCKGAGVLVYLLSPRESVTGDARTNLDILDNLDINVVDFSDDDNNKSYIVLKSGMLRADLIIDGIFGTGFKGEMEGTAEKVVRILNTVETPILSIDIPSGLDGYTGKVTGSCVRADRTVTLCLPKKGLILNQGPEYSGELTVADIGIPDKAISHYKINIDLTEEKHIKTFLPKRNQDSHKGDYGRVMIISGSTGMTGSGCLASKAALRVGAGLVYIGAPKSLGYYYSSHTIEPIVLALEDQGRGYLSDECIDLMLEEASKMDALAVGPGLSTKPGIFEIISALLKNCKVPLVLDADALNAIAHNTDILQEKASEIIITPHPGEMARLTKQTIAEIQENRIESARSFSQKWGVITVLKGSNTVVAMPDGYVSVNTTGNPGMSTAGSGDVLTGVIAGLLGQGLCPREAAIAGVYLHGMAGDMAAERLGQHGMIAGDITEQLPFAINRILA
jgi:hydroxyethylthiazole kinase-like uncharacterized protein yjeF